jgi:predicted Abi (CAAX) family protease
MQKTTLGSAIVLLLLTVLGASTIFEQANKVLFVAKLLSLIVLLGLVAKFLFSQEKEPTKKDD